MIKRKHLKDLHILTDDERRSLSKVKTSKAFARSIRTRNEFLYAVFDAACRGEYDDVAYRGGFGCPHCIQSCGQADRLNLQNECALCAWASAGLHPRVPKLNRGPYCFRQTFGGVHLRQVGGQVGDVHHPSLHYYHDSEALNCLDTAYMPLSEVTKEKIKRIKTLLLGHLEWAQRVLDGTLLPRTSRRKA